MAVVAESWLEFVDATDSFARTIGRAQTTRIGAAAVRAEGQELGQFYFRVVRPELQGLGFKDEELAALDNLLRNILQLSSTRSRRDSYVGVLRRIRSLQQDLGPRREMLLGQRMSSTAIARTPIISRVESRIIETLQSLAPSAGLSYRQAILDLSERNRLSYKGTANELREALREVLDLLAPDDDVMNAKGFRLTSGFTRPTQKQRVKHILQSRGVPPTARRVSEESAALIEELTASVTRATYERGSLASHVQSERQEVSQMKMYVDSVLAELLQIHREQ